MGEMEVIKQKAHNALKWSEKYTKTDMVYLARGGFWLTLNNILTTPMVFIVAVVFANKVPPETYGVYKFLLSTLGILSITNLSGMGSLYSQAVSRGIEGSLFPIVKTKIRWGLLGSVASIGIAIYYFTQGNTTLFWGFLIASLFIPVMDTLNIYQSYLQGKKLFKLSSLSYSSSQLIAAIAMISTLFFTKNLYIIFAVYLSSWTVIRLFFFLQTIKLYPPNKLTDPETIPYGIQSSFIDFLASIISSIDQILIFHYLGATELAFFTFATAPVTQFISIFKNIPALAMPKMAPRPIQEINQVIHKRVIGAFLGSLLVIGAYYVTAPFIYKIFFPQYLGSIWLSRIFVITSFFSVPIAILSPAVGSKVTQIPKKMLYFFNIPGIVATLFILITIQKIGVVSVIYSRIILVGTTFLISWLFWQYIVKKDKELISNTNQENPVQIAP